MMTKFFLILILVLGFVVRLYKIDSPIADWHSWRQADTAAVSRNFIKEVFNPLLPKGDDMSGISEQSLGNLGRFRFVEFPIYNIAVYPLYAFFGVAEKYSRLVSILFSLGSVALIYFITKRYTDTLTALLAAFVLAILPYNVYFSRTTLPEPTFIFFALGMMYFVDRWIEENKRSLMIIGFVFTAVAFLIKPWAIFFALPLFYSSFKKEGLRIYSKYLLFGILAIIPFLLWRLWINQYPEGIPASNWLYNFDKIRFKPIFFWWIISERIGKEILGVSGAALFLLGIIVKPKSYFLHFWLVSIFAYFVIFATGNVRHDYYQVLFAPVGCVFLAIGLSTLLKGGREFIPRMWTIPLAFFLLVLAIYFTGKEVLGLYQINNYPIVEAGKRADLILPKDARVIAPYNGDTAFLYQINRAGWPVVPLPIKEMIAYYGATHLVSVAQDNDTKWAMDHFQIMEQTPTFVIVDLTKLKKPLNQ